MNPAPGATSGVSAESDAKVANDDYATQAAPCARDTGDDLRGPQPGRTHIVSGLLVQTAAAAAARTRCATRRRGRGRRLRGRRNNGPFVLPGNYRATLTVDGKDAQAVTVAVTGDPEITISDADRKVWYETAMDLHQMQIKATEAAEMVQNAHAQLTLLEQQTREGTMPPAVKQSFDSVTKEMEPVRRRLGLVGGGQGGFGGGSENVRGRIGQLKNAIMGSTGLPTNTQLMQIREVKAALPAVIDQANAAAAKLPGLVKEMLGAGAIFPALKPIPK
jgi:hypothetical protein